MTLSRRDRAAMQLALEWAGHTSMPRNRADSFRKHRYADARWYVEMARDALDLGSGEADDLRAAMVSRSGTPLHELPGQARLLRARLALALRAMLRADRGDYGARESWLFCPKCGKNKRWTEPSTMVCGRDEPLSPCRGLLDAYKGAPRRYTPLWQTAPTTNTAPRPDGLRRRTQEETR